MSAPRILIAGVGNIFLGDDAFGVEVARRLAERPLPSEARVMDFGIRGFDLGCALLAGYETAILVDAAARGGPPGSLYVFEHEPEAASDAPPSSGQSDAHAMDPVKVLQFAQALGGPLPRVLVVGCEPAPLDADDVSMELSEPVRRAVDEAVRLVESLVARLLGPEREATAT